MTCSTRALSGPRCAAPGRQAAIITDEQIAQITKLYVDAVSVADNKRHPEHKRVKIFGTKDFGYNRITVERPLKLRFEITDDTIAVLENARALADWDGIELLRAFRGTLWSTKKEASDALKNADIDAPVKPATKAKAFWKSVSVADPQGEIRYGHRRFRPGRSRPA